MQVSHLLYYNYKEKSFIFFLVSFVLHLFWFILVGHGRIIMSSERLHISNIPASFDADTLYAFFPLFCTPLPPPPPLSFSSYRRKFGCRFPPTPLAPTFFPLLKIRSSRYLNEVHHIKETEYKTKNFWNSHVTLKFPNEVKVILLPSLFILFLPPTWVSLLPLLTLLRPPARRNYYKTPCVLDTI